MVVFNEARGRLMVVPSVNARRLPKRVSTKGHYWRGFHEGATEVWTEAEIQKYYERMGG